MTFWFFGAGADRYYFDAAFEAGQGGPCSNVLPPQKLELIEKNGYAQTVLMDRGDYSLHTGELIDMAPKGFDIVVDATGLAKGSRAMLQFCPPTGKIVIYGVAEMTNVSRSAHTAFLKMS